MRALVTAFGPFPGVPANPTELAIGALDLEQSWLAEHTVERRVLRTSLEYCTSWIADEYSRQTYDLVIHLGVAGGSTEFQLERLAHNRVEGGRADADGKLLEAGEIVPEAPAQLEASLDIEAMLSALRGRGFAVKASEDAGAYLCNFLYYLSLHSLAQRLVSTRAVFIHTPPGMPSPADTAEPGFPVDVHVALVHAVLEEALLRIVRQKGSPVPRFEA